MDIMTVSGNDFSQNRTGTKPSSRYMTRIEPMMKQLTGAYMNPLTLVDHPILLTATTRLKEYHSGIWVISHNMHITLEPSNKQSSIEFRRSATRCFLCPRRGSFLKAITPYVQNSWLPPAGRVRWHRDYMDTDLLIWLVLSHHHYDKFSCHDPSQIWVWRRHEMETFSASLALCEGNPLVTGGFP